jgi:ribokinase
MEGALYMGREGQIRQNAFPSVPIDTTAAGDTFTGYYLAEYAGEKNVAECLSTAAQAAAIAVSVKGAAPSIPYFDDVLSYF